MRVVEPHSFKSVKHPKKKRKSHKGLVLCALIVAVAFGGYYYISNQSASTTKSSKTELKQTNDTSQTVAAASPTPPIRTYNYCVGVRGVSESEIPAFSQKIDWTLNANRGWSLSNKLAFKKVDTGCDFTVWLSAPEDMVTFGGDCDSEWSCRAGNSVVANYDKWKHASEPWREQEGSIDFYQVMVVNHEVGHWFGFQHKHCGGEGQAAPVMQQQSVDLEGCVFNPWPTSEERSELQAQLGL